MKMIAAITERVGIVRIRGAPGRLVRWCRGWGERATGRDRRRGRRSATTPPAKCWTVRAAVCRTTAKAGWMGRWYRSRRPPGSSRRGSWERGTTGNGFSENLSEYVPTTAPRWFSYWPVRVSFGEVLPPLPTGLWADTESPARL
jgi:hypothetical protein